MRRTLLVVAVAALGPGALAATSPAAPNDAGKTRLVDRTLTCRTGYFHGARLVFLTARSAARRGDALDWLAQATVSTAGNALSKQNTQPTLAGLTAGWPPPAPLTSGALAYDNTHCGPTRMKVQLTARGLTGGVANAFGEDLRCIVGRTVLVRVRATFREPVEEQPDRAGAFVTALGRVVSGQLAVRTLTGSPIAYADVADGGRARLFTMNGCL